jgi:hypothetical protein
MYKINNIQKLLFSILSFVLIMLIIGSSSSKTILLVKKLSKIFKLIYNSLISTFIFLSKTIYILLKILLFLIAIIIVITSIFIIIFGLYVLIKNFQNNPIGANYINSLILCLALIIGSSIISILFTIFYYWSKYSHQVKRNIITAVKFMIKNYVHSTSYATITKRIALNID